MTIHFQTRVAPAASSTPIDHVHLARYTMGNTALELEVLRLFIGQAPSTLRDLEQARDGKAWHMAAHTMKGSAKAVGAGRLAHAAEQAEAIGVDGADRHLTLVLLRSALDEAADYIAGLTVPA